LLYPGPLVSDCSLGAKGEGKGKGTGEGAEGGKGKGKGKGEATPGYGKGKGEWQGTPASTPGHGKGKGDPAAFGPLLFGGLPKLHWVVLASRSSGTRIYSHPPPFLRNIFAIEGARLTFTQTAHLQKHRSAGGDYVSSTGTHFQAKPVCMQPSGPNSRTSTVSNFGEGILPKNAGIRYGPDLPPPYCPLSPSSSPRVKGLGSEIKRGPAGMAGRREVARSGRGRDKGSGRGRAPPTPGTPAGPLDGECGRRGIHVKGWMGRMWCLGTT